MVHKHLQIAINPSDDIFKNDKLERKNAIEDLSSSTFAHRFQRLIHL